jgi:hypothetical protein
LSDAKNKLESYIYGTKEKLESVEFSEVMTKEQKFEVVRACDAAGEWLAEHANDEIASLFRDQLYSSFSLFEYIYPHDICDVVV